MKYLANVTYPSGAVHKLIIDDQITGAVDSWDAYQKKAEARGCTIKVDRYEQSENSKLECGCNGVCICGFSLAGC